MSTLRETVLTLLDEAQHGLSFESLYTFSNHAGTQYNFETLLKSLRDEGLICARDGRWWSRARLHAKKVPPRKVKSVKTPRVPRTLECDGKRVDVCMVDDDTLRQVGREWAEELMAIARRQRIAYGRS